MSATAPSDGLYLRQLEIGPMQNYVYLVADAATREAAVIDPAWDIDAILKVAAADDLTLKAALVTHYHPDHLGGDFMGHHIEGAAELLERNLPLKVYIHKAEAEYVARINGLSATDVVQTDGTEELALGDHRLRFLHTPGHTPGSQCFLIDGRLISGDTLFVGSCGRVDLPGSDPTQMYDSLVNKLKKLPDDTVLYPGHNYAAETTSTIGLEKQRNVALRFDNLDSFLHMMGG
jgi:glyoxylase-like metal-dependent hydrolase (beta-lactamase superfamily II)